MASTLNLAAFGALLKTIYSKDKLSLLGYAENALFAMLPKMEDFGGDALKIPVRIGGPQGISNTFATAQANVYAQDQYAFVVTRGKVYGVARVEGETLDASMGNEKAFISALTDSVDRTIISVSEEISQALYGAGYGMLARVISNTGAGLTATLYSAEDSLKFWPGMKIKCDNDVDGSSLKANVLTVVSVNRVSGILTFSADFTTVGANDDYLFREGSVNNGVKGLGAWLPAGATRTAQLAAAFYGVTRSADPDLLGGIVYDGTGRSVEEMILKGASLGARFGAKPKVAFMSFETYSDLIASLGSKIMYTNPKSYDAEVYFPGVKVWTPAGVIECIGDRFCPSDRIYLLNLDEWKLNSLGKAPKILAHDGNQSLRIAAEDGIELRVGAYLQLSCSAPGHQIVVTK